MCKSKQNGGLGFRDLGDFNQALLAKQAWKILNKPNSLLSKLYKGRYFSSSSFLDCGEGYMPSYAWKSILFGRELLERGLLKSISTGQDTKIWLESWILDDVPRRPIWNQTPSEWDRKVNTLLKANGLWNPESVHRLFPPDEAERIMSIPTGNTTDCYIWPFTQNGSYSVKSGHWFNTTYPLIPAPLPSTQTQGCIEVKKRIWNCRAPLKIKMFLWRAVAGALAVTDRLRTRGLQVENTCRLCQRNPETISHVLFQCDLAQQMLDLANIEAPTNGFSEETEHNVSHLLDIMDNNSSAEPLQKSIPWILWGIWKNRNAIVYEGKQEAYEILVRRCFDEANIWHQVNEAAATEAKTNQSRLHEHWQAPSNGIFKCNMHANWRNSSLLSGGAWIGIDDRGEVLYHARDAHTQSPNRITAEFRCLRWCMQSAIDLRLEEVVYASDCKAMMDALSKPQEWPKYRFWLTQIRDLQSQFRFCGFEMEAQQANGIARDIARSVLLDGRFQSYLAMGGPAWLHDRIRREAR